MAKNDTVQYLSSNVSEFQKTSFINNLVLRLNKLIVAPSIIEITPSGTWTNYNAPWRKSYYMKDYHGNVTLCVMVKSGTSNSVIFTLPVGYRPGGQISAPAQTATGPCLLDIYTDGTVVTEGAPSNAWVTFNVTFRAEQ